METKKSPRANLENKKKIMYMIGFVMVLAMVYIALEWSKNDIEPFKPIAQSSPDEEQLVDIPPTTQVPPPPPPPPLALVDEIIIVDNDKQVADIEYKSDDNPEEGVDLTPVVYGDGPVEVFSDDPVIIAEIMPRFIGDVNKYLSENIKYPQIAIEVGLQGRVTCQFVINRDGSIVDVEVVRGVHPSLDKEALRVIKSMPKWKPGIQNGKTVRVKFYLPVNFRLM